MAGILDGVDQRTRLAGHNRLELLLFRLGDAQRFGINVFKVQEVVPCPPLTRIPNARPVVKGLATLRGRSMTIIDLGQAIGRPGMDNPRTGYVIVTEYNRSVQGFVVTSVDRIINMKWEEILPPPQGAGSHYMTAVTHLDGALIEIIDVEKVLADVVHVNEILDPALIHSDRTGFHILVADDSSVARRQIRNTLSQLGVRTTIVNNGREALQQLKRGYEEGEAVSQGIDMVISDIEMPEMDGYTLTTEIRSDPKLRHLYVILHTSLSGVFNNTLVEKVGANEFIAKFDPGELARAVVARFEHWQQRGTADAGPV